MRKLVAVLMLSIMSLGVMAQTQQELIEAYRNGTLSQSQIDALQKKSDAKQTNVQRARKVNAETAKGGSAVKVTTQANAMTTSQSDSDVVLSGVPADPQQGLLDAQVEGGVAAVPTTARRIFGHDMFTNARLTFEPNLNIATPEN